MTSNKAIKLIIISGGGHAKVVIDALYGSNYDIVGILEKDDSRIGEMICGVPIIGTDDAARSLIKDGVTHAVIGIGNLGGGSSRLRQKKAADLKLLGYQMATIIHPSAVISRFASVGEGTVVFAGAVVNAGAVIGENCIINTNAIVEHDVVLEANVHVAPNAAISGKTVVGANTFIGMGSSIIHELHIGADCIIGAGSTVIRDVPDSTTVMGTPACPKCSK